MDRTTNLSRFFHPLLPDPPPFLLKHVTKTSIAVPALPVICNLLKKKKKGVEDSRLKGKQVPRAFSPQLPRDPFRALFRVFFPPPFSCAFAPKHFPNERPKNVKNLKNRQTMNH